MTCLFILNYSQGRMEDGRRTWRIGTYNTLTLNIMPCNLIQSLTLVNRIKRIVYIK